MPFSSDDDTIDFIYGVISWKEIASRDLTDELVLEVGQALRSAAKTTDTTPIWADGPSAQITAALALSHQDPDEMDLMDTGAPDAEAPHADWLALVRDAADDARAPAGHVRSVVSRGRSVERRGRDEVVRDGRSGGG